MTRCAVYIRKSREDKDKLSHRLTVQREQLPAHAQAQGWQTEIYDDGHASAARGKAELLPERNRLEVDIRSGKINIILTIELSRLSRDDTLQDYVAWLTLCSDHRVKLATMSRVLDPAQHSDWMLLLMEGGFSSVEMKVLRARMEEGRQEAYRAGKYLGGVLPPPYVLDKAAGRPVVDETALIRMRQIWHLAEQHGTRHIAQVMDLPVITVRRAISDDRLLFCQARRLDPTAGAYITCDWEPVLTEEQADHIRDRRTDRRKGYNRQRYGGLLSNLGILVCGYCGRSVRSWSNSRTRLDGTKGPVWYGCKGNEHTNTCPHSRLIQQHDLDRCVITHIFGTLSDMDGLQSAWETASRAPKRDKGLMDLDRAILDLESRKQRLVHAIAAGVINFADAKTARNQIEADLKAVYRRRFEMVVKCQPSPDWDALALGMEEFDTLDRDDRREFITLCLSEIRLFANYATCTYKFPRGQQQGPSARIHLPPPKPPGKRLM